MTSFLQGLVAQSIGVGDIHEDQGSDEMSTSNMKSLIRKFQRKVELVQFTGEKTYSFATFKVYIQDGSLITDN